MPDTELQDLGVRVYAYRVDGDFTPATLEELLKAHRLRNTLVEIERTYSQRVAEVWAAHPRIAEQVSFVESAETLLQEAVAAAKDLRQRNRSTDVGGEQREKVKLLRAELRTAKATLRELKAQFYPEIKAEIAEAGGARKASIKALYRVYMDEGLYWATYNDVVQHHELAVKMVKAKHKDGKPAELKFRRWTGEGTLTVQLQRGKGQPARTPTTLASPTGPWRNVLAITPALDPTYWATLRRGEQRALARTGHFLMRYGSGDQTAWVDLPLILHRPMPPDGDIVMARLTRRLVGGKPRVMLNITVRERVPLVESGPPVAVHIGWRALPSGRLRVAMISGDLPDPPESLGHVVHGRDGLWELSVPASWRELQARHEGLDSVRSRMLDEVRAKLVAWAREHPDCEGLEHVEKWRAPGRFAGLTLRWRQEPPEGSAEILRTLETWRRNDKHLWTWVANGRDKLVARRRAVWNEVGAWITGNAGAVVVDVWDIDSRQPSVEEVDDYQARAARANRVLVAPGELREVLFRAGSVRGVSVEPSEPSSRFHLTCGTQFDPTEQRDQVFVWCSACEASVDQDANAVTTLLATLKPRPT